MFNNFGTKKNETPGHQQDLFRPSTLLKKRFSEKVPYMSSIPPWLIFPNFEKFCFNSEKKNVFH